MDDLIAARAAEYRWIVNKSTSCISPVQFRNPISAWKGRDAYTSPHQFRARHANPQRLAQANGGAERHAEAHNDANTKTNLDSDGDPNSYAKPNPDADSGSDPGSNPGAPDLQPRLHDRDGKRGIEQPDWE